MSENSELEEHPAEQARRYLKKDFRDGPLGRWERFRRNVKAELRVDVYSFLGRLPPGDRDPVLIEMEEGRGQREVKSLFLIKREGRGVEDLMDDLPKEVKVFVGDSFGFDKINGELKIGQDSIGGLGGLRILEHDWAILIFFHELAHAERRIRMIQENFPGFLEQISIDMDYFLVGAVDDAATIQEIIPTVTSGEPFFSFSTSNLIEGFKKEYAEQIRKLDPFFERLKLPNMDDYRKVAEKWTRDNIERISSEEYRQLLTSTPDRLVELERLRKERHLLRFSEEVECWNRARKMKKEKEKKGFTIVGVNDEMLNQYVQLCLATYSSGSEQATSTYKSVLSRYEKARKQPAA